MSDTWLILVAIIAASGEVIDSSLGMMYGTLLSPILILCGYSPTVVIPSILLSQAVGGGVASIRHHSHSNVNLKGMTRDMRISLAIIVPGVIACIAGAFVGQLIPSFWLKLYIGLLVLVMGALCVRPIYYSFTWTKMWMVGLVSGFNKALSGGGFGPVTSTGKILGGVDPKVSVGTTTLAEVPVCVVSFIVWLVLGGSIGWKFPLALCVGALVGGMIGPYITARMNTDVLRIAVGCLAVACGIWLVAGIWI